MNSTTSNKKRRISYGFKIDFPSNPFTLHEFRRQRHDVSYITASKRIHKALKDGVLVTVGTRKAEGLGRPQQVFATTKSADGFFAPATV
jgi:hypothetical protein